VTFPPPLSHSPSSLQLFFYQGTVHESDTSLLAGLITPFLRDTLNLSFSEFLVFGSPLVSRPRCLLLPFASKRPGFEFRELFHATSVVPCGFARHSAYPKLSFFSEGAFRFSGGSVPFVVGWNSLLRSLRRWDSCSLLDFFPTAQALFSKGSELPLPFPSPPAPGLV